MSTVTSRWGAPLAAAAAVAALIAAMWQLPGSSPGGSGRLVGPTPVVVPPVPTAGSTSDAARAPVTPLPRRDPNRVLVDSYTAQGHVLTVRYTIDAAECSARIDRPVVVESVEAVTVTLRRLPVKQSKVKACADLTLSDSVRLTLSAPLGGRAVRDGSRAGRPVPAFADQTAAAGS